MPITISPSLLRCLGCAEVPLWQPFYHFDPLTLPARDTISPATCQQNLTKIKDDHEKLKLTTQTNFPFPLCIGLAGHIGLLGRCSGMLNSKNETSFTGSLLTAALGSSHHCLFSGACPFRYENTLGVALTEFSVELLEFSSNSACLISMNRLRAFPLAVFFFSGGVSMCFASYNRKLV